MLVFNDLDKYFKSKITDQKISDALLSLATIPTRSFGNVLMSLVSMARFINDINLEDKESIFLHLGKQFELHLSDIEYGPEPTDKIPVASPTPTADHFTRSVETIYQRYIEQLGNIDEIHLAAQLWYLLRAKKTYSGSENLIIHKYKEYIDNVPGDISDRLEYITTRCLLYASYSRDPKFAQRFSIKREVPRILESFKTYVDELSHADLSLDPSLRDLTCEVAPFGEPITPMHYRRDELFLGLGSCIMRDHCDPSIVIHTLIGFVQLHLLCIYLDKVMNPFEVESRIEYTGDLTKIIGKVLEALLYYVYNESSVLYGTSVLPKFYVH